MKKLTGLLLALVMCVSLCIPAFAIETPQPRSDTIHYHTMKKTGTIGISLEKEISRVDGTAGRNQTEIRIDHSTTYSATLDVLKLVGTFTAAAASSSGLFTVSVSKGLTVGQTYRF